MLVPYSLGSLLIMCRGWYPQTPHILQALRGGHSKGDFPSSLKFLPGVGLGGGVKFLIYFLEGGGGYSGQPGNSSGYTLSPNDAIIAHPSSTCLGVKICKSYAHFNKDCLALSLNSKCHSWMSLWWKSPFFDQGSFRVIHAIFPGGHNNG